MGLKNILVVCLFMVFVSSGYAVIFGSYAIKNETGEHIQIAINNIDANHGYFKTLKPHSRFVCDRPSCDKDYPAMTSCKQTLLGRACALRGNITIPGCGHKYLYAHQTLLITECNGRLYCHQAAYHHL